MKPILRTIQHAALLLPVMLLGCQPESHANTVDGKAPCCEEDAPSALDPLPDSSLYNLESSWTDQKGTERLLSDFQGTVTVAAMIFTHCDYACPRLLVDLKAIETKLGKSELDQVHWLLLSMDSERDVPAVLEAYAERNGLDTKRWTLMHGDSSAVRELAATLGVRYKRDAKGNYSHSNLISVLDAQGRIHHRLEGLGADGLKTVAAIQELSAR